MVLDRAGGQKYRKWRVWLVARPPKPSLVVENLLSLLLFLGGELNYWLLL